MVEEREIITLLLGVATLGYFSFYRSEIGRLPSSQILFASFIILFVGWSLTVIEAFIWTNILNVLEHVCYSVSSILLATWSWFLFHKKAGR